MAERLLLDIQYECARNNIDLPWDRIAHRMSKSAFYTPSNLAAFCRECRTDTLLHAPYFATFLRLDIC